MGERTMVRPLLAAAMAALLAGLLAASAPAAPVGTVTEFSAGIPLKAEARYIASGPDGNMWFTESGYETTKPAIARITPAGTVTQFNSPLLEESGLEGIAAGADGNLWFTDSVGRIGQITPGGTVKKFSEGITYGSDPDSIASGPEGNMWFTEYSGRIGRITPAGAVHEFELPPEWKGEDPRGIAVGPEGDLWFVFNGTYSVPKKEYLGGGIGRMTPAGEFHGYPLTPGSRPLSMAQGPDGNMWFTYATGKIGRITPAGVVLAPYSSGISPGSEPADIAPGPEGEMWFTEYALQAIGRISVSGTVTEFKKGVSSSDPIGIAAGPDGNMWFAQLEGYESQAQVGSIVTGAAPALLAAPAVTGGGVAGTPQQCSAGQWSSWTGMQPASSLFSFDGYRFMLDGAEVATGQSFTPPVSAIGHSLTCAQTVSYGLQQVTASATSAAVTVSAPPAPVDAPPPTGSAPVVSGLRQSSSVWRLGTRTASIARRRKPPLGTTFSFSLSERASVALSFTHAAAGRRSKGRCVPPSPANRRGRPCKRAVRAGTLTLSAHAGHDRIGFQGRLAHGHGLRTGTYTVTVVATDASGRHSQPQSLRFTIVR